MSMFIQRVVFRFRGPSGSKQSVPSEAMHEALMLLSEADELQPRFLEATKAGKVSSSQRPERQVASLA
jgi:hypothetical protein